MCTDLNDEMEHKSLHRRKHEGVAEFSQLANELELQKIKCVMKPPDPGIHADYCSYSETDNRTQSTKYLNSNYFMFVGTHRTVI